MATLVHSSNNRSTLNPSWARMTKKTFFSGKWQPWCTAVITGVHQWSWWRLMLKWHDEYTDTSSSALHSWGEKTSGLPYDWRCRWTSTWQGTTADSPYNHMQTLSSHRKPWLNRVQESAQRAVWSTAKVEGSFSCPEISLKGESTVFISFFNTCSRSMKQGAILQNAPSIFASAKLWVFGGKG